MPGSRGGPRVRLHLMTRRRTARPPCQDDVAGQGGVASGIRDGEPAGVSDPFGLQRFVDAQAQTYDQALREVRAGAKRTHWMWFVFPQLAGLGRSAMAQRFAISGLPEAQAYVRHPTLGPRLVEVARALTALDTTDPAEVFGAVDSMKLRSSMTLFAHAAPDEPVFREVLDHYFGGTFDEGTTSRL